MMIRLILFTPLLCFILLLGCTTDKLPNNSSSGNTNMPTLNDTLISDIEFRIENYYVDTLANYRASDAFINKYSRGKGYDAFLINYNNPNVNAAVIKYYILDTLVNSDLKVLIIMEDANIKSVGSRIFALILNSDDSIRSITGLASSKENSSWLMSTRSYIIHDTLHRISTLDESNAGLNKVDTTHARFRLNGFRNVKLLDTKSWSSDK
jgi:hypothetical protein